MERFIPEHPLPTEIREMPKDDTVCQFCGVSYLIHSEMKALEERVKEAERKMQYYVESVEREEKLKVKVASMEEESDKLSRALQASDERTKILVQELTSKQSQIENCKQQKDDLEKELQRKNEEVKRTQLKLNDLVRQISSFHETLQTQRTALNDIKVSVRENCCNITESYSKVVNTVALSCEKFAKDTKVLEESLSKCENEKKMQHEAIGKAEALVMELTSKCTELEGRVDAQEKELIKTKEQNHFYSKELSQYKELMNSKVNEVNEWKNKFQSESGSLKEEIKKNQGDLLSKEKQIQQLVENCKNLEKQVAEYSKARNDVEEKSANSLEEIKALKESCFKAKNEVTALKEEREMMISAHHNRIEQLRESFKKKMEEADAWPEKLNKIVKEKEEQFNEEKNNLWRDLTEGFQKEMDEEQQKHQEELGLWKKEAKAAQDRFKEDITTMNRRHREDIKRLERELTEAKEKSEQTKNADDSLVQNLEAKIVDLENRLRQPLADSEEVLRLRTRLQESDKMLKSAEQQINELETRSESWRQEVVFLQETVRRECEERFELTDALGEARAQLLALQRTSGASLSRSSLNLSTSSSSVIRGSRKGHDVNGQSDSSTTQAISCPVGFDGGVGCRPGTGSRDTRKLSREGSVDDSRKRIAAAVRQSGTKSRLGGNFSS
nr:golgin subfamily A member 6-like protein 22 [Pocillopora verrucosa]